MPRVGEMPLAGVPPVPPDAREHVHSRVRAVGRVRGGAQAAEHQGDGDPEDLVQGG